MNEQRLFVCWILFGCLFSFQYDWIECLRNAISHNNLCRAAEDLCYWFCIFWEAFYLLHFVGNGTVRWFMIMGLALGMFFYRKIAHSVVIYLGTGLISLIFLPIKWMNRVIRFLCAQMLVCKKRKEVQYGQKKSCISKETTE